MTEGQRNCVPWVAGAVAITMLIGMLWWQSVQKNTPSEEQLKASAEGFNGGLANRRPAHLWVYLSAEARRQKVVAEYSRLLEPTVIQITLRGRLEVGVGQGIEGRPLGWVKTPITIWGSDGQPIEAVYGSTWVWEALPKRRHGSQTHHWALLVDRLEVAPNQVSLALSGR